MPFNTTYYDQSATDTLRLGSKAVFASKQIIWKHNQVGTNLQNLTKPGKIIYIPSRSGYKFYQRDQSGAEAKVVAYLCRKGNLRALFDHNIKPHVFVALHVFQDKWKKKIKELEIGGGLDVKFSIEELIDCAIEDLRKHPHFRTIENLIKSSDNWPAEERYYFIGKQICHSSNYGVGAHMFMINTLEKSMGQVVIDHKSAVNFLDLYHNKFFPEVREWHRDVLAELLATRTLRNLQGFPRFFHEDLQNERTHKAAFAYIPQSTIGTITNIAFTQLQNYIELTNKPWNLLANTHDSYMTEGPESDEVEIHEKKKEYLNAHLRTPRGDEFQMLSEGVSGWNWAPYHPEKNPRGLKGID